MQKKSTVSHQSTSFNKIWQSMIILLRFISVSKSFKSKVKLCGKCETLYTNETAESVSIKFILHRYDVKDTHLKKSMMQEPVLLIRFSLAYVPSNQLRSRLDKPYLFAPMYQHDIKEVDSPTLDGFHLSQITYNLSSFQRYALLSFGGEISIRYGLLLS